MKTLIEFDSINHLPTLKHALDEMLGEGTYRILPQAGAAIPSSAEAVAIDMILYCPNCGKQHVDAPESGDAWRARGGDRNRGPRWMNPPHRSHLCHGCGCTWRPADIATNGVESIKTEGKADTWPVNAEEAQSAKAHTDSNGVVAVHNRLKRLSASIADNSAEAVAWRGENILRRYPEGWAEYCTNTIPVAQAVSDASALAIRLLNAVDASEFGGITCLDIDGEGNWFDVRDRIVRLLAAHTIPVAQTGDESLEINDADIFPPKALLKRDDWDSKTRKPRANLSHEQQPPQAQKAEGEALTLDLVRTLWINRPSIHDGDLGKQLFDFAQALVDGGYYKAPPITVRAFGNGELVVHWGTYADKPCVYITDAKQPGEIGASAARENIPKDALIGNEVILTFPTMEKARAVESALFGLEPAASAVHDKWRKSLIDSLHYLRQYKEFRYLKYGAYDHYVVQLGVHIHNVEALIAAAPAQSDSISS